MPKSKKIKEDLRNTIRDVHDFPKKGIIFKDVTTILQDGEKFRQSVDLLAQPYKDKNIDKVVCVESRGFIFGAAIAYVLGAAIIPVRKQGKLPYKTHSVMYELEYGSATLEIHQDAISEGDRVLIIDDLLATGGTALAAIHLVEKLLGKIEGICFLIELTYLKGRSKLTDKDYPIFSLIQY